MCCVVDMKFLTMAELERIRLSPSQSLALEMCGDEVRIKVEEDVPSVSVSGISFHLGEPPSVVVAGKKHYVGGIA